MTMTLAPRSALSPAMKPWISETDSAWPVASSASIRSTKPRIGSRLVGSTSIMRQSNASMVGVISPRTVASVRRTQSSAVRTKSVWGNSLKTVMMSAPATRRADRWLWGSKVTPITASGARARQAAISAPSGSTSPSAIIAPCRPSSTASTGRAARNWSSISSRKPSQVARLTRPPGSAQVAVPSIRVMSSRARSTGKTAEQRVGVSGCRPGGA